MAAAVALLLVALIVTLHGVVQVLAIWNHASVGGALIYGVQYLIVVPVLLLALPLLFLGREVGRVLALVASGWVLWDGIQWLISLGVGAIRAFKSWGTDTVILAGSSFLAAMLVLVPIVLLALPRTFDWFRDKRAARAPGG